MLIVAALVFNSSVQFFLGAMSSLYPAADFSLLSIFNKLSWTACNQFFQESVVAFSHACVFWAKISLYHLNLNFAIVTNSFL
jgi:hypothetical protein